MPPLTKIPNQQQVKERLESVLLRQASLTYGSDVSIQSLQHLSGGASRETWSFDVHLGSGETIPLILKRDPLIFHEDGRFSTVENDLGVGRIIEGRLIEMAGKVGVPVPEVAFYLTADDSTTAGFVTERMNGEALGTRILKKEEFAQARTRLAFQCGHAAARFHGIAVADLPELQVLNTEQEFDYYRRTMHDFGHPQPGFEYGLRWLEERQELAGERIALVHGDYRNGNILVDANGLQGVLDWELGHIGNPLLDLGWICVRAWRYGFYDKTVGGFGELEQLLAGYKAGGGGAVDPESVRFWEIFGTIRWGVICIFMMAKYFSGEDRSLEKAAIGRRTAETEYDLLQLIDAHGPRWRGEGTADAH